MFTSKDISFLTKFFYRTPWGYLLLVSTFLSHASQGSRDTLVKTHFSMKIEPKKSNIILTKTLKETKDRVTCSLPFSMDEDEKLKKLKDTIWDTIIKSIPKEFKNKLSWYQEIKRKERAQFFQFSSSSSGESSWQNTLPAINNIQRIKVHYSVTRKSIGALFLLILQKLVAGIIVMWVIYEFILAEDEEIEIDEDMESDEEIESDEDMNLVF